MELQTPRQFSCEDLTLFFDTPTFMHGADQKEPTLRITEFKSELRKWFRVAKFAELFNPGGVSENTLGRLRESEFDIFGGPQVDEKAARASRIKILTIGELPRQVKVKEAMKNAKNYFYLGYGIAARKEEFSEANCFFSAENDRQKWQLRMLYNNSSSNDEISLQDKIKPALMLLNDFGTVGNRSNQGWGSVNVEGLNNTLNICDYCYTFPENPENLDWCFGFTKFDDKPGIWGKKFRSLDEVFDEFCVIRKQVNKKADKERGSTQVFFKAKYLCKGQYIGIGYCMAHVNWGKHDIQRVKEQLENIRNAFESREWTQINEIGELMT
jgi:CRISPR type III-B/RAMP module RAMP protein Cmr1